MRGILLASACAGALVAASTSAHAQTTPPATDSSDSATQDENEVVVTAQRRSERLQTTPIAASVLSGSDLANQSIVNVDALQFAMPSVTVNNFGQGLEFNIRGIGKAEHNTQTTTGVITYRDSVATFPGYFQEEPYFDIGSVEVLRGPQGTIAGQNSTGGAVFVSTNNPVIGGGVHGYLQGQFGNYTDVGLQGAINLPVSDTFAARVAFYTERRDGFYHITGPGGARYSDNNDLREAAVRLSFLWRPSSRLTIVSKTDLDFIDMGAYPSSPFRNRFRFFPVGSNTPNPTYSDLFTQTANSPQAARDKFVRSSLRIDYDLDFATLRSITAYQGGNTQYRGDLDGTATGNFTFFDSVDERAYSQEVNLISPNNGRFTWLLGAYAQWDKYTFLSPFQFLIGTPAGNPATEYRLEGTNPERSLAAFGQIGFLITPRLKLELGGRYTESRTTNHVLIHQNSLVPIIDEQTAESNNFSYKVSLGWEVDPHNFLYAFRATGFRQGGLNVPVGLGNPAPFEPERVTSWEAGWRANFMGGHIRTTINAFYNDYRNFQVIIGYPAIPVFGIEVNVPNSTKIYGAEVEAELHLGHFSLDLGASLLHSKLGTFYATDPRAISFLACDPATGPASVSCLNLGGQEQTYAPNFTFNAAAQYEFVLGGGDTLTARANYGHVAGQWATLFENVSRGDRLGGRNIFGAQLSFVHGPWTATLYGTNITNQHYVGALNSNLDFAGPPRQYGLRVLRTF
jgi:iron complex outermembrane receptor protein